MFLPDFNLVLEELLQLTLTVSKYLFHLVKISFHLLNPCKLKTSFLLFLRLTSGTTWHSAGMVNTLKGSFTEGKLYAQSLKDFSELEKETGVSPGFKRHGGLTVTRSNERLQEFK